MAAPEWLYWCGPSVILAVRVNKGWSAEECKKLLNSLSTVKQD